MKLRFLCSTHKLELVRKPGVAIHVWQTGFDTGQLLFEQGEWQDALYHLGCAFEAAEILMSSKILETDCAYELFISSSVLLVKDLTHLDHPVIAQDVQQRAIARLQQELAGDHEQRYLAKKHLKILLSGFADTNTLQGIRSLTRQNNPYANVARIH